MAQYDVHRNPDAASAEGYPFILDIQANVLEDLDTRMVVPLATHPEGFRAVERLMPVFSIEGRPVRMVTPLMAGVSVRHLGEPVTSLADRSYEILDAVDFLLTGV